MVIKQGRNSRTRVKCKKATVFFHLNCFQLPKSVCLDSYDNDVYWRESTKHDFPCILHISLAKNACTQLTVLSLATIFILFVASLTQLVSSQPRDSSETFLLGKLVGKSRAVGNPYAI